jgi:hypothetical protein
MFFAVLSDMQAAETAIYTVYGAVGLARADPRAIPTSSSSKDILYFEVPDEASEMVKRSLSLEGIEFSSSPLLIHLLG